MMDNFLSLQMTYLERSEHKMTSVERNILGSGLPLSTSGPSTVCAQLFIYLELCEGILGKFESSLTPCSQAYLELALFSTKVGYLSFIGP